jgi:hypothetical protein
LLLGCIGEIQCDLVCHLGLQFLCQFLTQIAKERGRRHQNQTVETLGKHGPSQLVDDLAGEFSLAMAMRIGGVNTLWPDREQGAMASSPLVGHCDSKQKETDHRKHGTSDVP